VLAQQAPRRGARPPRASPRRVEKALKLRKEPTFKRRNGRQIVSGHRDLPLDERLVVDLDALLPAGGGAAEAGAGAGGPREVDGVRLTWLDVRHEALGLDLRCWDAADPRRRAPARVWTLAGHEGLYVVRGALAPPEQLDAAAQVLHELCDPPAVTNLHREVGPLPPGLFEAAGAGAVLDLGRGGAGGVRWRPPRDGDPGADPPPLPARELLSRLRWTSIGPPFDWTRRQYLLGAPRREVPPGLAATAAEAYRACRAVGKALGWGVGLPDDDPGFSPDAGLVNYYRAGDALMAHRDDAEADMRQPIVALSLGCPGVFVKGGLSRDDEGVAAVLVRSGDAVVLDGVARRAFHGVPRVLCERGCPELAGPGAGGERAAVAEYLQRVRVSVSLRRVGGAGGPGGALAQAGGLTGSAGA